MEKQMETGSLRDQNWSEEWNITWDEHNMESASFLWWRVVYAKGMEDSTLTPGFKV